MTRTERSPRLGWCALGAVGAVCLVCAAELGCAGRDGTGADPDPGAPLSGDAAGSPRHWPRPPSSEVYAVPPHAIRSDGVGPYVLEAPLSDVLRSLPEGPRVEILQVGRLVNWRVVHAENGGLIIGADRRNRVAFIAVLSPGIASTGSGVGVGSTGAEVLKALGPDGPDEDSVYDRRSYRPASLPGVRFITDAAIDSSPESTRVVAVLVTRPQSFAPFGSPAVPADPAGAAGPGSAQPAGRAACRAGGMLAGALEELASVARGRAGRPSGLGARIPLPLVRYGCFTGGGLEAAAIGPGELAFVGGEAGRLRRLAHAPLDTAHFAGAIDVDGDTRDELVVGVHRGQADQRSVNIRVFRWDAGRLVEAASERPFVVSAGAASAAGVSPTDVDLAVEVRAFEGALAVGGLYLVRSGGVVRELAPIEPVWLRVDWRKNGVVGGVESAGPPQDAHGERPKFLDEAPDAGPEAWTP